VREKGKSYFLNSLERSNFAKLVSITQAKKTQDLLLPSLRQGRKKLIMRSIKGGGDSWVFVSLPRNSAYQGKKSKRGIANAKKKKTAITTTTLEKKKNTPNQHLSKMERSRAAEISGYRPVLEVISFQGKEC